VAIRKVPSVHNAIQDEVYQVVLFVKKNSLIENYFSYLPQKNNKYGYKKSSFYQILILEDWQVNCPMNTSFNLHIYIVDINDWL
jgi:hypothetical protein